MIIGIYGNILGFTENILGFTENILGYTENILGYTENPHEDKINQQFKETAVVVWKGNGNRINFLRKDFCLDLKANILQIKNNYFIIMCVDYGNR